MAKKKQSTKPQPKPIDFNELTNYAISKLDEEKTQLDEDIAKGNYSDNVISSMSSHRQTLDTDKGKKDNIIDTINKALKEQGKQVDPETLDKAVDQHLKHNLINDDTNTQLNNVVGDSEEVKEFKTLRDTLKEKRKSGQELNSTELGDFAKKAKALPAKTTEQSKQKIVTAYKGLGIEIKEQKAMDFAKASLQQEKKMQDGLGRHAAKQIKTPKLSKEAKNLHKAKKALTKAVEAIGRVLQKFEMKSKGIAKKTGSPTNTRNAKTTSTENIRS